MSEDSSEEAYKSPLVSVAGNKEIQIVENSKDAAGKDRCIFRIDRRLCNQALEYKFELHDYIENAWMYRLEEYKVIP